MTSRIHRRRLVSRTLRWLSALALAASGLVHAQTWPTKPVRLIVPVSAGGMADILSRTLADALSKNLGQPFVVDIKPGAAGAIGSVEVANAPADGYTLLVATSSTHAVNPVVRSRLPYNAVDDFTPLALLTEANNLLLVSPTLGVKNLSEFLALAKQKPGYINYSTSGIGSFGHLLSEYFQSQAGVTLTHVPYKGTGASITDLVAGQVHMTWDALPSGLPRVKEGQLLGLTVSGLRRSSLAPDIPTIGEAMAGLGLPRFSAVSWNGLYGPRGMSPGLVQRINDEVNKVLRSPEIAARFASLGIEPGLGSAADFANFVAKDRAQWAAVAKNLKLSLD